MAQSPSSLSQSFSATPVTKRLMMALMGGAGLILLGGGGALVGLNSHLAGLQTAVHQKQQEVNGSEGIAKRYITTQAAYTQTQNRMQCLEASVSPKSYVPTLLGQLQALAATTHLNVIAVRPGAPAALPPPPPARPATGDGATVSSDTKKAPPPPPYDTLEIDVDTTGTYADTAAFMYSLTRFPKIISVTAVQMHPSASTDKSDPHAGLMVTTNLKLVAFMFHEDVADTASAPAGSLAQVVPAVLPQSSNQSSKMSFPALPTAPPTVSGAIGRAAQGAVGAVKATNARGEAGITTL